MRNPITLIKLKPRLNELSVCIYCEKDLPSKTKEHIFNSCWGGVHKTGQIICDECNSFFSNIDGTYGVYTKIVMNAYQFKGQRHKSVPIIETESPYVIGPGGVPIRETEFIITTDDDGIVSFSANAKSKTEVKKLFQSNKGEIEKKLGRPISEEEIEKVYQTIKESQSIDVEVGTLPIPSPLFIQDQYRSAAHTILKCLAMFDPETLKKESLKELKHFSRYSEGDWREFAITAYSMVSILDSIDVLKVKYNAVEIFYSSSLGKIIGCLKILGRVSRWIIISNEYTGPDRMLFIIEEVDKGGKVDGMSWESNLGSLPIVQITSNELTEKYFIAELQEIAYGSIAIDAPANELLNQLEKLSNNNSVISDEFINEMVGLFLDYGKSLLKLFNISRIGEVELQRFLINNMINEIGEKYNGKPNTDSSFHTKVSNSYNKYISYIMSQKS